MPCVQFEIVSLDDELNVITRGGPIAIQSDLLGAYGTNAYVNDLVDGVYSVGSFDLTEGKEL